MRKSRQPYACVLLALAALGIAVRAAAAGAAPEPDRWEADIRAFEERDRAAPPPRDAVLFVGSSSIRLWDLPRSFPGLPAINRGFGGSCVSDSVRFVPRIVLPYAPAVIVLYAGDNDITAGKAPEAVRDDYRAFVEAVHERLPAARIAYIAIKPSIQRWKLIGAMRAANALIEAAAAADPRLAFVNLEPAMLGADGIPRRELFAADGLHLSAEGYALWAALLAPHLRLPGAETRLAANPWAIEQVKTGKLRAAHAHFWGFDPDDATAALRSAIASGAPTVVVNDTGAPWIADKIDLTSDQEVVFERGVVVRAKPGAFKGKGDCLFTAARRKNVTLTGRGARFEMRRQDYTQPPYDKAEWRHALSILSCADVRVTGLTLADSGGDGIYLGVAAKGVTNSNVRIEDVVCERNHRQGISVISAENLLIERCILRETAGTAPMAGIDFEPNHPTEKLAACVMRDCTVERNRGVGFDFYLNNLGAASFPVSIRLERCRSLGNREGVRIGTRNDDPVAGVIEFADCEIEHPEGAGIAIHRKPAMGCAIRFERCLVRDAAVKDPALAPIVIASGAGDRASIGGIAFIDCVVGDPIDRLPLAWRDFGAGVRLVDVTGTLAVEREGHRTTLTLDKERIDAWFPSQAFKIFAPFETEGARFAPAFPDARPETFSPPRVRQRERAEFLLWARAADQPSFTTVLRPVGQGPAAAAPLRVFSPSGKEVLRAAVSAGSSAPHVFTAEETGAYRIAAEPGSATLEISAATHRVCLYSANGFFHFLGAAGELFFQAPAGVREFGVKISGGNDAERVRAAVRDASGAVIQERDSIAQTHQFVIARADPAGAEIWSLRFEKPSQGVLEDFFVELEGLAPVLAGAAEALLIAERH